MKKTTKKVWGIILVMALVITSMNGFVINTKADDKFSSLITEKGTQEYDSVLGNLRSETTNIDGRSYTNYTSLAGVGVSSKYGENVGQVNTIDRNTDTFWQDGNNVIADQALIIKLPQKKSIKYLQVSWSSAAAKSYNIDFSYDGSNWTTVAYVKDCQSVVYRADQIQLTQSENAKYIRIQGVEMSSVYAYKIFDVGIYGDNTDTGVDPISVDGIVSTPTTESPTTDSTVTDVDIETNITPNGNEQALTDLTANTCTIDGKVYNNYSRYKGVSAEASSAIGGERLAIDGNINTRWESQHRIDPQYITVDFGNTYLLKKVSMFWEDASAKNYSLEVSSDGINYQSIKEIESNIGGRTDEIVFSKEINVRAIRINCHTRNTDYGYSIYEIGLYGTSTQAEVVPILSNLKVRDYAKYTGKYFIYFNQPDTSAGYNVYIDNDTTPLRKLKGSGEYISTTELQAYAEGQHTLSVTNIGMDGGESSAISTTFNLVKTQGSNSNIPQVYINSNSAISQEYHDTADISVSIIDKNGGTNTDICDAASNVKIRGNTTAGAPKKPWNIKLSGKKSVLGMDKGKKWCLLANSFDKSLIRNKLSYDMGLETGVTYTSQSRYVEVYLNGVFQGNYLMTEPVEANSGKVEIDAYNADNNDILLELGTRNEIDVDHFNTTVLNTIFDVNDPEKGDDLTDQEVDTKINRVREYLNEFETALKGQNYSEILNYIDEDTFVNFYIVNELFKNVDFNFSSTRFYIKDNKIYAGPLWDFDLSSGNCKSSYYTDYYVDGVSYKGFYCQNMNWYKQLMRNASFMERLKARYKSLQSTIQGIYKTNSTKELSIDYLINNYGTSFQKNYEATANLGAGWSLNNDDGYSLAAEAGWTTWKEPIEFLRSWLKNRNEWICGQWGIDYNDVEETTTPAQPETTTPTPVETTTSEQTTTNENTVVEYKYDNTGKVTGDDMTEYADAGDDYIYNATAGSGTMKASINGTNLKHVEWGEVYGGTATGIVPIISASKVSKNTNQWKKEAYVAYTFSTLNVSNMSMSIDVGCSKKGPANLKIVGADTSGNKYDIGTCDKFEKNKTMYNYQFDLPKQLGNQTTVTVYVTLATTENFGGVDITDPANYESGELAFNNFTVTKTAVVTKSVDITGYQMSTGFNGVDGSMGVRVVYQAEPAIDGKKVSRAGLIYGLEYNGSNIDDTQMVIGSANPYVKSYDATARGKVDTKMGDSQTADYYIRTMSCNFDNPAGYNAKYYVRSYAVLEDGTVEYSDVYSYTIFDIASNLYDNVKMLTKSRHDYLFTNILKRVDSEYKEVKYLL